MLIIIPKLCEKVFFDIERIVFSSDWKTPASPDSSGFINYILKMISDLTVEESISIHVNYCSC